MKHDSPALMIDIDAIAVAPWRYIHADFHPAVAEGRDGRRKKRTSEFPVPGEPLLVGGVVDEQHELMTVRCLSLGHIAERDRDNVVRGRDLAVFTVAPRALRRVIAGRQTTLDDASALADRSCSA